jgi:hypothetical protein
LQAPPPPAMRMVWFSRRGRGKGKVPAALLCSSFQPSHPALLHSVCVWGGGGPWPSRHWQAQSAWRGGGGGGGGGGEGALPALLLCRAVFSRPSPVPQGWPATQGPKPWPWRFAHLFCYVRGYSPLGCESAKGAEKSSDYTAPAPAPACCTQHHRHGVPHPHHTQPPPACAAIAGRPATQTWTHPSPHPAGLGRPPTPPSQLPPWIARALARQPSTAWSAEAPPVGLWPLAAPSRARRRALLCKSLLRQCIATGLLRSAG